jgi:hypothetical protein
MNVNELIDFNLHLLKGGLDIRTLELRDLERKILDNEKSLALFKRMSSESLIFTDQFNRIKLSTIGYEILKNGGWLKHIEKQEIKDKFLSEKEQLDFEKTEVDLELAKKVLKEFPKTKWFARIGLLIAIVLALKELYILIKPQL